MDRRGFLKSILAAGVAPAFVGSSVLMPVRKIISTLPKFLFVPSGGTGATSTTLQEAFFNGRIWVHNEGKSILTISQVEWGDWKKPTPYPVELQPGDSLVYDVEVDSFSRYEPKTSIEKWDVHWVETAPLIDRSAIK